MRIITITTKEAAAVSAALGTLNDLGVNDGKAIEALTGLKEKIMDAYKS